MEAATVINITRTEVAHRAHTKAVERVKKLEVEIDAAFNQLLDAQEIMKEDGVHMTVMFSKPVDAAWAAWMNKRYADA